MKICIGLLSNRGFEQQMVLSLMQMIHFSKDLKFHFEVATEGYTIAENRNSLAAKACQNKCTHILMIDDDMTFTEDLLTRLLAHDKDIVGVTYGPRMFSTDGMLFMVGLLNDEGKTVKDIPKELFRARGIGFGAALIKTELFYKLERPWFDWVTYETGMVKEGEDFYFCSKAREAGYDVWCDPTLKLGHIGKYTY